MCANPSGTSPLQPGGVARKLLACVPVVRQPGDAHHIGAEVGKDHGAERARSPALELDDLQLRQRP